MSFFKKINIFSDYKKYNIPIWEYPPFIFFIMGLLIIGVMFIAYFISTQYFPPEYVVFIVMITTIILLVLDYIIVNSFQGLAEANLMKAEFMRIVSHQLKTPLTNLKWTIDLASSEKDLNKIGEYFSMIQEQNEKMIKLIDDMLIALRVDQKRWISQKEEVNLEEVIEEVIKKMSLLANSHNVEIKVEKEKTPNILIDRSKINKAIENLVDNAIEYSQEKGGIVTIQLKNKGNMVSVIVEDNGVGIPEDEQRHIFKKFFRSKNVLRYQTQGLGLSLFIVRAVIEEFGGKISFHSEEKKGTKIWFELPVK